MDINAEKIGPCKTKVSINIPAEQVDEEFEKTYSQTAKSVTLPGFRKGKAPKKLISKRFGEMILEEVKEKLVQKAFTKALKEHKLEPVNEPDINLAAIDLKEGTPLEFTFEMEIKPEFELGEFKGIEVEQEPLTITDAETDEGVMSLRSRFASLESVKEGTIEKKHYLTVDITYRVEGEEIIERKDSQANLSLGIVDGIEIGPEGEKFIGKKINDSVELEIPSLPEHFLPEKLRGRPARMTADIKDIRKVTFPEVDEEFLKKINMKNMGELREKIQAGLLEQKKVKQTEDIERKIVDLLVDRNPFEIPEKLLMQQITSQEQNLRLEMMRLGLPRDKVEEEAGKLDEKNREAAERNIRANFIYDEIAKKEKIHITENEMENEFKRIAQQQNTTLQEVKQYYEEQKMIGNLRVFLRNQKIRKMLRESAKLVEKKAGQAALEPDGSEADKKSESSI